MMFVGKEIFIRFLNELDAEALCGLEIRNRTFFQKYSIAREDAYYTIEWQRESLSNCLKQRENDEKYSFGIFMKDTEQLIGDISLFKIERGPKECCMVGYALDEQFNGKGYMSEAIRVVVEFAFNELSLHRIEAGAMPHNIGSVTVLERVGFCKEGIAKKNVKINGKWEDHQMLAIISDKN
ncbi:GNAT family N-acetyltransferase [Clostridium sp.]|uniref:GNAT family N-acetyltransferase n=1 Tax=Clostridium sp. TaxID=1506 RepID=UPI003D6D4CFB